LRFFPVLGALLPKLKQALFILLIKFLSFLFKGVFVHHAAVVVIALFLLNFMYFLGVLLLHHYILKGDLNE